MTVSFVPYGRLTNGNYGILLDPATKKPTAAAIEVLSTLPDATSSDNFDGRSVFDKSTDKVYVYSSDPTAHWISLEGVPATVGNVAGVPPTGAVWAEGDLYWDRDTQVLFVWTGAEWQAAGGRYASQVVENLYAGNGTKTVFPSGSSNPIQSAYVEIFVDGVRQRATVDYNLVGTSVNFTGAPHNGATILIRSLVSSMVVQNAQATTVSYTGSGTATDFDAGQAGVEPSGAFVFVDGVMKRRGTDYDIIPHNTKINSLAKTSSTVARATTASSHNLSVGAVVTLVGFAQSSYNNVAYTVTNIPASNIFEFSVSSGAPSSGTGNPIMSYTPAFVNDIIRFNTAPASGKIVDIRCFRNVVLSGAPGESNTLTSTGSGVSIANGKSGSALRVKSLVAGTNMTITDGGNSLTLDAASGLSFEERRGISVTSYQPSTESYIGVQNTSNPVAINLSSIIQTVSNNGRRITVVDESGGAGTNNIQINGGSAYINGSSSPYVINTNYGFVTLVMNGTNWFVVAKS